MMEKNEVREEGFTAAIKPVLLVLVGLVAILVYAAVMLFPTEIVHWVVMALGLVVFGQILIWGFK